MFLPRQWGLTFVTFDTYLNCMLELPGLHQYRMTLLDTADKSGSDAWPLAFHITTDSYLNHMLEVPGLHQHNRILLKLLIGLVLRVDLWPLINDLWHLPESQVWGACVASAQYDPSGHCWHIWFWGSSLYHPILQATGATLVTLHWCPGKGKDRRYLITNILDLEQVQILHS